MEDLREFVFLATSKIAPSHQCGHSGTLTTFFVDSMLHIPASRWELSKIVARKIGPENPDFVLKSSVRDNMLVNKAFPMNRLKETLATFNHGSEPFMGECFSYLSCMNLGPISATANPKNNTWQRVNDLIGNYDILNGMDHGMEVLQWEGVIDDDTQPPADR